MNLQAITPGAPAFRFPPALPVSAGGVSLPQDQVALTATPTTAALRPEQRPAETAPEVDKPVASATPRTLVMEEARPTPPEDDHAWRATARRLQRRQNVESLLKLKTDLEAGALEGEAFGKAATTVWRAAHRGPDPLTRRIGRQVLFEGFQWPDKVQDASHKEGPGNYCIRILGDNFEQTLGFSADRTVFPEELMLDTLEVAASVQPDQDLALAVAQTAHFFARRSHKELGSELREKESAEQDQNIAGAALDVLEHWRSHGCLTIRGSLDELATTWPLVRPGLPPTLEIARPPELAPWPAGTEKIADDLAAFEQRPEERQRGLQGLLEQGAPMLDILVARTTASNRDRDDTRRLANVLAGAREHPELRGWLAGHLPRLTHFVRDCQAAGHLCPNNLTGGENAQVVRELTQTFPEVVTPEYFRQEVMGLALAPEINTGYRGVEIARDLWLQRPELRDVAMESAIELPERRQLFHLDHPVQRLLSLAAKDGWKPSGEQKDWLSRWLYLPPPREARYLRSSDTYSSALQAAAAAEPGSLADQELPDKHGSMVPLVPALLDQVLDMADLRDILGSLTGSNQSVSRETVYQSLATVLRDQLDLTTNERLLAELGERYAQAGGLAHLDERAQLLLATASLQSGNDGRLAGLLASEEASPSNTFKPLLDRLLRVPAREQAMERLSHPDVTAAEIATVGAEALRISQKIGGPEVAQTQARLVDLLKAASPVAVREQGEKLLKEVTEQLARAESSREVAPEHTTRLITLMPFLQVDRELRLGCKPLLEQMERLAEEARANDPLVSQRRPLGAILMAGQVEAIEAAPPDSLRPVLEETLALVEGYGSADIGPVLDAWRARVSLRPRDGDAPLDILENGFVALANPELRADWLKSYRDNHHGRINSFLEARLSPRLFESETQRLASPGRSYEQRLEHLELLEQLAEHLYVGFDRDPIGQAFKTEAQPWEVELYETTVDKKSREDLLPFYRAIVSAPAEPGATWRLLEPLLRRFPRESRPSLLEAVQACRRTDEPFLAQLGHYGAIAGHLGAHEAPEATRVFRHYQDLREAGYDHEKAYNRALATYLNPGSGEPPEARSGVEESSAAVNVGGVMVRKRR